LVGLRCGDFYIWVPAIALTEVEPSEPPNHSVVAGLGLDGESQWVFERDDGDSVSRWLTTGRTHVYSWAEICALVKNPAVLVPDRFAEPVELPWVLEAKSFGDELRVERSRADYGIADLYVAGGHVTNDEARAMGLALLKAARS
jgi:hypothetical protein